MNLFVYELILMYNTALKIVHSSGKWLIWPVVPVSFALNNNNKTVYLIKYADLANLFNYYTQDFRV